MIPSAHAEPVFPPLLRGQKVAGDVDAFSKAMAVAATGIDAGLIVWADRAECLDAAIVLAPETRLDAAMAMVPLVMVGLGDAIGALAPPEVAVTWRWPDVIEVNGAACGVVRAGAATRDPEAEPDWLVIGVTLQFTPLLDEPGRMVQVTALHDEGCVEMSPVPVLEAWARHTLVWLNRWSEEGFAPVHESWRGRCPTLGEETTVQIGGEKMTGLFVGITDYGDALLKTEQTSLALPLTGLLDDARAWPDDFI